MFKRVIVRKLTGQEDFQNTGSKRFNVLDFWKYGFSNTNSNVLRGALAEFIVENALKDAKDITVRNPWGDFDVGAPNGTTIKVKCCSYIQDWDQKELSKIVWAGLKAKNLYWSSAVGPFPTNPAEYKSDVYVLALLKHQDPTTLNILDLDQWCFYVLSKARIKEATKNGSSISLRCITRLGLSSVRFNELANAIASISATS